MATVTTTPTPEQLQERLNGPAGKPPAGVLPNYQNPPNLNAFLILTLTLVLTFGTLAILMRMYTKLFIIRSVAYEDYAVMLGWLFQVAEIVPSAISTRHGGGSHMWNIRLKTFFDQLYWINLASILYCPVVFFLKLSILLQYLRIFVPSRKANMFTFAVIQLCIWSSFTMYLVAAILAVVQCIPREKIWNPLMTTGRCIDTKAEYLSLAIFNVITDFAILVIPMPSLWKLRMLPKKKILTTAVFATGFLACVTSILRTYYTWQVFQSRDISYNAVKMGFWAYAEIGIGIIVSCVPVLPRFLQHFSPKIYAIFASKSKSKPGSSSSPRQAGCRSPVVIEKPRDSAESSKRLFTKGIGRRAKGTLEIWNEAYHPSTVEVKGEYVTLDEYDAVLTPEMTKGNATKRDDLESGSRIGGTII